MDAHDHIVKFVKTCWEAEWNMDHAMQKEKGYNEDEGVRETQNLKDRKQQASNNEDDVTSNHNKIRIASH